MNSKNNFTECSCDTRHLLYGGQRVTPDASSYNIVTPVSLTLRTTSHQQYPRGAHSPPTNRPKHYRKGARFIHTPKKCSVTHARRRFIDTSSLQLNRSTKVGCDLHTIRHTATLTLATIRGGIYELQLLKWTPNLKSDRNFESERLSNVDSAELTESPVSHWCRSTAATAELRRRLTGKLAGGDGRFPAAARAFHARAKGGFLEARTASSGLRLRRAWCLRLRLDERNTMMGLDARDSQRLRSYGRFTKTAETKLKNMAVSGYLWLRMMVVASSTVWRVVAPATSSENNLTLGQGLGSLQFSPTYKEFVPEFKS
ncbi:hypothetical protein YC2023_019831 [Brassica napus]